jgi:hypothetical protein
MMAEMASKASRLETLAWLARAAQARRPWLGTIEMRPRLQRYLPIFLIALLVQVLAPIGVYWAAALAASDPLSSAEICHSSGFATDQPTNQGGQHGEHGNGCSICCLASASTSIDIPPWYSAVVYCQLGP